MPDPAPIESGVRHCLARGRPRGDGRRHRADEEMPDPFARATARRRRGFAIGAGVSLQDGVGVRREGSGLSSDRAAWWSQAMALDAIRGQA